MTKKIALTGIIPDTLAGQRIDQALAQCFPDYSRARLCLWLKNQHITVNNKILRPKDRILGGEHIIVDATLEEERWEAESIPLDVIYEDDTLMVINKPAGLVVHPAHGNFEHTLVNALLFHCSDLAQLPRAGLIHRLDKDTTGLLVIAKTLPAHHALVKAMQQREIQRTYQTIVYSNIPGNMRGKIHATMPSQGTIRTYMSRHPNQRLKMAVTSVDHVNADLDTHGKPAVTHYTSLGHYPPFSHLKVQLETGRTHQIRVHMAHIKHPIIGDPLYGIPGKQAAKYTNLSPEMRLFLDTFSRQALHAYRLSLVHPKTHEIMTWTAPLPEDMQHFLNLMKEL